MIYGELIKGLNSTSRILEFPFYIDRLRKLEPWEIVKLKLEGIEL